MAPKGTRRPFEAPLTQPALIENRKRRYLPDCAEVRYARFFVLEGFSPRGAKQEMNVDEQLKTLS